MVVDLVVVSELLPPSPSPSRSQTTSSSSKTSTTVACRTVPAAAAEEEEAAAASPRRRGMEVHRRCRSRNCAKVAPKAGLVVVVIPAPPAPPPMIVVGVGANIDRSVGSNGGFVVFMFVVG